MRGFASLAIAVMAIALIAYYAGISSSSASSADTLALSLESRQVSWRSIDSEAFLSNATLDAVLDSAYAVCGCGADVPASFNATLGSKLVSYFANASAALGDAQVTSNYSRLWLPSFAAASCNSVVTAAINYTIAANSTHVRKTAPVSDAIAIGLLKDPSFLRVNATRGGFLALNVTVTC